MRDGWLFFVLAVVIGGAAGDSVLSAHGLWVIAVVLLFAWRCFLWKPGDYVGRIIRPKAIIFFFCLIAGFLYAWSSLSLLPEPVRLDKITCVGELLDWRVSEARASGVIRLREWQTLAEETEETEAVSSGMEKVRGGKYRITVYPDSEGVWSAGWDQVRPGDILRLGGALEQPKAAGTPGTLDLRIYYQVRGWNGSISVRGEAEFLQTGSAPLPWRIRDHIHTLLSVWPPEESGVLEGILFGDSSGIPSLVQEQYKITGVLHVFAASGSNVAFVLLLSWGLFRWLPRRFRILLCMGSLILYAVLCGGEAPIVRATVLGLASLGGKLLGRGRVARLRWLGLAAFGLFCKNPLILLDAGFQLSFAAAWGISELTALLEQTRLLKHGPPVLRKMSAVTLAAQAATLPILMNAFHRLSLIGLITNLGIILILGSVFELGLIGAALSFLPFLALPLFQASLWLLQGTNAVLEALASLPWSDVWVIRPGAEFTVFWYGLLLSLIIGKQRVGFMLAAWLRRRCGQILSVAALAGGMRRETRLKLRQWLNRQEWEKSVRWLVLVMIALLIWRPWGIPRELELSIIDVGQGDSILIKAPGGSAVLIDTGPRTDRFDAGEKIVLPYLLHSGVKTLTGLILTHEDSDHIGGARAVLANMPVEWIGVPAVGERLLNEGWREGLSVNGQVQNDLRELRTGDRIELGGEAWLEVLAPDVVLEGTRSDPNNNSLVLRLHYYAYTVLLTGDMEEEEMAEMLDFHAEKDWDADFFKEPHHGSKYSLNIEWLDAVHPQAVFISVGKNTFGHPAPEIMDYWEDRGVPVYQTYERGTIRLYLSKRGAEMVFGRESS